MMPLSFLSRNCLALPLMLLLAHAAVAQSPSPTIPSRLLTYLEKTDSFVQSFHMEWDEVTVAHRKAEQSSEAHTKRELWSLPGGFRYTVEGEQFDTRKNQLLPIHQKVIDDGVKCITFSSNFDGKGARGAVETASGSEAPSVRFLPAVLALRPFAESLGGIAKGKLTLVEANLNGIAKLKEERSNGSTRYYYLAQRSHGWCVEMMEMFSGGKKRYQLSIEYGQEAREGVALPTRWVLTRFAAGNSVIETTTGVQKSTSLNPRDDRQLLDMQLPEGTALTNVTSAEPAFAYVSTGGHRIALSQREVFQTYQQVQSARRSSFLMTFALVSGSFLLGSFVLWRFLLHYRGSRNPGGVKR